MSSCIRIFEGETLRVNCPKDYHLDLLTLISSSLNRRDGNRTGM